MGISTPKAGWRGGEGRGRGRRGSGDATGATWHIDVGLSFLLHPVTLKPLNFSWHDNWCLKECTKSLLPSLKSRNSQHWPRDQGIKETNLNAFTDFGFWVLPSKWSWDFSLLPFSNLPQLVTRRLYSTSTHQLSSQRRGRANFFRWQLGIFAKQNERWAWLFQWETINSHWHHLPYLESLGRTQNQGL